ncbi:MAG TPA: DNA repair protein RecN [Cyclobacteriaceae bacterium]|nr:DNA repair protein RecN [Cyclobacteriaceae bacterium]
MLQQLTIRNYALIRHLELRPSPQLTVITGETGAGKSIMLGAIGLLMGNRADTKVLWDESEKCVTEGIFDIQPYRLRALFEAHDLDYQDETVFRREISPGGKSRAFINDTPVTLDVMRKIGARLMDVHSQHETLELGSNRFQLSLIDSYAGHAALLADYQQAWQQFLSSRQQYEDLAGEATRLKTEYDFIRFQLDELQRAELRENELEELESNLAISEHGEDIKLRLNQALAMLGHAETSAQSVLAAALTQLNPLRSYASSYDHLVQRLDSVRIELTDLIRELEHEEDKIEFDPKRTTELKDRLDLINGLLTKHRLQTISEVLALQETLEQQARKTINLDADLASARAKFDESQRQLQAVADKLSASRAKTYQPLTRQLVKLLRELGIGDAVLQVDARKITCGPTGADEIKILFSANKGIAPRSLEDVASGGEFSRLMFCVKYVMAEKTALPTLVLDEIDTGVSGEIAIQLGKMMKAMSKRHQLITISHLPQIAARGDQHYLVYKDNAQRKTTSEVKVLQTEERVEEIAKMIGGAKPSELARASARELMAG